MGVCRQHCDRAVVAVRAGPLDADHQLRSRARVVDRGIYGGQPQGAARVVWGAACASACASQPRGYYGMLLAHCGVAVFIVGVTLVKGYESERDVRMAVGDSVEVGGYAFRFDGAQNATGPNYRAARGSVVVSRGGKELMVLHPEKRIYNAQQMPMTEAAISTGLFGDLYVSLGEPRRRRRVERARLPQAVRHVDLGRLHHHGARRFPGLARPAVPHATRRVAEAAAGASSRRRLNAKRQSHEPLPDSARGYFWCSSVFLWHRPGTRSARSAVAADRQARARIPARRNCTARQDARHRGHAGPGVAAQRVGVVVRFVPRRASGAGGAREARMSVPIYGLDYKDKPRRRAGVARADRRSLHGVASSTATGASASTTACTACPKPS